MTAELERSCERVVAGRYALFDELGVGGMATVHLGTLRGAAGFTRTVAIKRLHPSFVRDPEFVSMLIDEARLASRIRHPNVVQTIDVVLDKRELFVVMEYIHGETLANLLRLAQVRQNRIPFSIAATIVADVLHGLHAAHETKDEKGRSLELVHRDISPQNIMLGTDGLARVLDFGIAKSAKSLHVSQSGTLKGKFGYIAPEQIGDTAVTRQADIYSASVVLWEALTGHRLFHGEGAEVTLAKVLAGDVRPPSEVVSSIPVAFDAVVLRGLSRNPAHRYESAKAMAADLERCCTPESHSIIASWLEQLAVEGLARKVEAIARIEQDVDSSRAPDLQQLVGQLVQPESVSKLEIPPLLDALPATVRGVNRASGVISVPTVRRVFTSGKHLAAMSAVAGSVAVIVLLVAWARVGQRRAQTDSHASSLTVSSVETLAAPSAISSSDVILPSTVPIPSSTAGQPSPSQTAAGRIHGDNPNSKKASPRHVVGQTSSSAASKPKALSPFHNLGGRN